MLFRSEGKPIRLIDGKALLTMIREVQAEAPISDQSSPVTGAPEGSPNCPKCEKPMVRRTAQQGPYAAEDFWACSDFPKCSGQRPLARF